MHRMRETADDWITRIPSKTPISGYSNSNWPAAEGASRSKDSNGNQNSGFFRQHRSRSVGSALAAPAFLSAFQTSGRKGGQFRRGTFHVTPRKSRGTYWWSSHQTRHHHHRMSGAPSPSQLSHGPPSHKPRSVEQLDGAEEVAPQL